MTVCLLLISDGREDYLEQTLHSAEKHLPGFDQTVHIDDTSHELGFAGAIQAGWDRVRTDHVFHLEADFTFNRPVPVASIIGVLQRNPHLAQIALLRQPWNPVERAAGGIIQTDRSAYTHRAESDDEWIEHRKFWTTNPCIYPRSIVDRGWPQCNQSEGLFGLKLFAEHPELRAAFWGDGSEWVTHIGHGRAGHGY